jgi:dTDP-4-dehydrorhamnose reductase
MKILVTGSTGMLARALIMRAQSSGHEVIARSRVQLDVTDADAVQRTLTELRPDVVFQGAGYTRVDDAEDESGPAHEVNAAGAAEVARVCRQIGALFVYPSTDYVFDGKGNAPYRPDHPTAPISEYGRSKLAGEQAARSAEKHLIVRTSWLYGAGGRNFVSTILRRARSGDPLRVVNDQHGGPTWTCDLAQGIVHLIERAPAGTYHFSNAGETTWFDFARAVLEGAGLRADLRPTTSSAFQAKAARPTYSVLDCTLTEQYTGPIRSWGDALADALRAGV